jgi:hypothetical protein
VQKALIRITAPNLQIYDSFVTVEAHFQGLRYFMYHWRFTTGALFISVFMFWYAVFGLILWRMFLSWFRSMGADGKKTKPITGPFGSSSKTGTSSTGQASKSEGQSSSTVHDGMQYNNVAGNRSSFDSLAYEYEYDNDDAVPDSDDSDEEVEYIGGVPTTFVEEPASVPLSSTLSGSDMNQGTAVGSGDSGASTTKQTPAANDQAVPQVSEATRSELPGAVQSPATEEKLADK